MLSPFPSPAATRRTGLIALLVLASAGCTEAQQEQEAQQAQQAQEAQQAASQTQEESLYARLGGVYPIAVVVDDFIDRLLVNDVLNANPAINEARDRVPAPGLKYRVTELVCQVTGGPCTYTGRSMKAAHAHLNIGESEWEAMLSDLRKSLDKFQVPAREQEELIAIVESTKPDIVTRK